MPPRKGAAEQGVPSDAWRRVSPLTPALDSWKVITVVLAVLFVQNIEVAVEFGRLATENGPGRVLLYFSGGLLTLLALVGAYSYFAWRSMTYAVTDQAVWMRKGVVFRQQRHVRLERIQSVDVTHPLLGRIFGLGRLTVAAAGAQGSSVSIGFLATSKLEDLRAQILARAAGVLSADTPETEMDAGLREPPERLLYTVSVRALTTSLLLSANFIVGVGVLAAIAAAMIVLGILAEPGFLMLILPTGVPLIIVFTSLWWTHFSREFNFQAAASPDGIRIRRGLLERRAETIPPRRVHAVRIAQPLLWRRRNWFRVEINQAAQGEASSSEGSGTSSVLLPVGTREEAMMALWLILPDLGVDDPTAFFDEAVSGTEPCRSFQGIAASARFLDPLVRRRRGIALTRTCLVIRDGRLTRTASFAPYERVQSVAQTSGPLERRLKVSSVIACLVPGVAQTQILHLADEVAAHTRDVIVSRSEERRGTEPPERWFARVKAGPTTEKQTSHYQEENYE